MVCNTHKLSSLEYGDLLSFFDESADVGIRNTSEQSREVDDISVQHEVAPSDYSDHGEDGILGAAVDLEH